jgi:N-glycosylase/DNA lyase
MPGRKNSLSARIKALARSDVGKAVAARVGEFERCGRGKSDGLFREMCFCVLTANYAAEPAIRIQREIGGGFITLSEKRLAAELKKQGYRFPNARAGYIVEARKHMRGLRERVCGAEDETALRDWLAENVKGLGMKEASHFLRNIGFKDVAILDFHIIDILADNGIIKRPKTLTPKRYREIEAVLRKMGAELGMNMAELDLYLWYMETGKILK